MYGKMWVRYIFLNRDARIFFQLPWQKVQKKTESKHRADTCLQVQTYFYIFQDRLINVLDLQK